MQRCPTCRWQIPDDAASCSYCGQSLHPDAEADEERRRRLLRLHMFNAMRRKSRPSLPAVIGALLTKPFTVAIAVIVLLGAAAGVGYARWATAPREPSFDLSGVWIDEGYNSGASEIIISYTGKDTVRAEFVEEFECDPRDGTPIQKTKLDFEAKLTGNQLEGYTSVCYWGYPAPTPNGLVLDKMTLTISPDGETLKGHFIDSVDNQPVSMTIIRKRPSGLKN